LMGVMWKTDWDFPFFPFSAGLSRYVLAFEISVN